MSAAAVATVRPGQGAKAQSIAPQAPASAPQVDLYKAIQFLPLAKTLALAATATCTFGALL